MPKERLLLCQAEDRAKGLSEHHLQQLKVYFTQCRCCVACLKQVLGHSHHSCCTQRLSVPRAGAAAAAADIFDMANSIKLRQRVAATAVVYFRRLYAGSSFGAYDPHLVAPGCLYLASKVCVWLLNRLSDGVSSVGQVWWSAWDSAVSVKSSSGGGSRLQQSSGCVLVGMWMQVEESVVAGKLLLASMRRLRPAWHYELKDLLDMEMVGLGWSGWCFGGVGWGGVGRSEPVTHTAQHNGLPQIKAKQSCCAVLCTSLPSTRPAVV